MTAFVIAVVAGVVVGIAYLTLAARSFRQIRSDILSGSVDELGDDETYDSQGGGFALKAGGGAVASALVLAAITLGGAWWYVVPFLSIGTAVAVVVAFLVEERSNRDGVNAS